MRVAITMLGLACVYWLSVFLENLQYMLISTVVVVLVTLVSASLEPRFSQSKLTRLFISSLRILAFSVPFGLANKYDVDLIPLAFVVVLSSFLADGILQSLKNISKPTTP